MPNLAKATGASAFGDQHGLFNDLSSLLEEGLRPVVLRSPVKDHVLKGKESPVPYHCTCTVSERVADRIYRHGVAQERGGPKVCHRYGLSHHQKLAVANGKIWPKEKPLKRR